MIQDLDDNKARKILSAVVRSHAGSGAGMPPLSGDLKTVLIREFQIAPGTRPVSGGELARQALLVLAEDPATRAAIETMAANWDDSRQKFDFGASLGIAAAVLLVLQTHIKFEKTPDGKWSLKVEKKPTSEGLLKALVEKLINFHK
ncbi:MAG TPA: hypothetical protein VI685_13125 [Candidatus Angelobacter sp.]